METPLAADTPLDVERLQVDAWRRMTPDEKAALITALTQAAYEMTWAGVRARHPGAPERELFLRVAILTLGPELACAAYPDAAPFVSAP
jgi:hypothetical protein